MDAAQVTLSRRGLARWHAGHPWIYQSDVVVPAGVPTGAIVRVVDGRGGPQGSAFYSAASKITLRRLAGGDAVADEAFFQGRLVAADALRQELFPGGTVYRVVHGEADGLPGLVVDRYGDYLVVQFLIPGTDQRRELFTGLLAAHFNPRGIVNRSDLAVRRLEGLAPDKGLLQGEVPESIEIREGNVRLGVSLLAGQKTGAFLDQRENRLRVRRYARGRALDCFSYHGAFALQLAAGADQVIAVEGSAPACEQIRVNIGRNDCGNVAVECANVFDFLRERQDAGEMFDTIVLDPPAFAKHRGAVSAGLRGYREINLRALRLLRPGGCLITASCSYHVDEDMFEATLQAAAADARREVQVIERLGASRDHPVLLALRETRYLKCYVLRAL